MGLNLTRFKKFKDDVDPIFRMKLYIILDNGNLFYITCSCYKLKKVSQACYAQVLMGILRPMSYSLLYLTLQRKKRRKI